MATLQLAQVLPVERVVFKAFGFVTTKTNLIGSHLY
jgi:hypothetical protein